MVQTLTTFLRIQTTSTLADGWDACDALLTSDWREVISSWTPDILSHSQIKDGQRELIRSHSVKNRHFIGNTSMDAGLSFIMANHAKVKENDLVFDPFVGTGELSVHLYLSIHLHTGQWTLSVPCVCNTAGSLLVACSHFGAYVCGTDIDYNTIHGKGECCLLQAFWVFNLSLWPLLPII